MHVDPAAALRIWAGIHSGKQCRLTLRLVLGFKLSRLSYDKKARSVEAVITATS